MPSVLGPNKKKQVSQWEAVMKKFTQERKETCRTESLEIDEIPGSAKYFPTGSKYEGAWDVLGMNGHGRYTYPDGIVYEGELEESMFHGQGELQYVVGDEVMRIRGTFDKGIMTERTLLFSDTLQYKEKHWKYCTMPDRRFAREYDLGLLPAGKSYLTEDQPTKEIPPGFYDSGDGFYDDKTKVVYKYTDPTAIVRSPSIREQKWIVDNCRTSPEKPLGPLPELYEKWSEPVRHPIEPSTSFNEESLEDDFKFCFKGFRSIPVYCWRHRAIA